jgi:hypothetical protein
MTESTIRRAILLASGLAMLALLLYIGRWLTFWYDEWSFILDRPDPTVEALLSPHVDHLSLIPVLLYQGLLRGFGLASYWPYLALLWLGHFASVVLLYRITVRSAGPWVATAAALSLLTLGCAFEDLLQAFQLSFLLSTAFGLLAIERLYRRPSTRPRDVAIAGFALAVAVASSSVGVIMLGVVLAWGLLDWNRDRVLAAVPVLVVYALWYVAWGRFGSGPIPATSSDPLLPVWSFGYGLGAAVSGIIGLPPERFAPIGLIIGVLAFVALLVVGFRSSTFGVAALLGLFAMYALQGVFRSGLGVEHAARSGYLYPAAIFLWLAIADGLPLRRSSAVGRNVRVLVMVALMIAIVGNLAQLVGAGRAMRGLRTDMLAELRFLDSVRAVPGLALDVSPDEELMPQVTPRRYLPAIDRFGRPRLAIEADGEDLAVVADPARLNAAALRMLAGGFGRGGTTTSIPPEGLTMQGGEPHPDGAGCIAASGPGPLVVNWIVGPGDGFSIVSDQSAPPILKLGVRPSGLAAAPPSLVSGVPDSGIIVPPVLPNQAPWYAEVDSDGSLKICRASTRASQEHPCCRIVEGDVRDTVFARRSAAPNDEVIPRTKVESETGLR